VRGRKKHPQHKICRYLLRNLVIDRPNMGIGGITPAMKLNQHQMTA